MKVLAAIGLVPALSLSAYAQEIEPQPTLLADGVLLLSGNLHPNRGPDGNTVIFEAAGGLAVIDTGRHAWHSDAIVSYARSKRLQIPVIVNTHWHLDHSSGNVRVKAAFPDAKIYTSNAVDAALAPSGFLMREYKKMPGYLSDPSLSPVQREEVQIAIQTMENRNYLRPDVVVSVSGPMSLAGRGTDVHLTDGAVTDADVWIYDTKTRIVVAGDLVTLPAPFFETACPNAWSAALAEIDATPFELLIPGHGAPMSRVQFEQYRRAFDSFTSCVRSASDADACASGWTKDLGSIVAAETQNTARDYAKYYVGFLRNNGGKSPDCKKTG